MANLAGKNMVPEPINTTATARLALALGKDSAVYFLEVFDILEFAMSHLHMVSPGTGTLHTGTLQVPECVRSLAISVADPFKR